MGVSKNRGKTPKRDGLQWKNMEKLMIWGFSHIFGNSHILFIARVQEFIYSYLLVEILRSALVAAKSGPFFGLRNTQHRSGPRPFCNACTLEFAKNPSKQRKAFRGGCDKLVAHQDAFKHISALCLSIIAGTKMGQWMAMAFVR